MGATGFVHVAHILTDVLQFRAILRVELDPKSQRPCTLEIRA